MGQVDIADVVHRSFRDRRVVSIDQRDWRLIVTLRADEALGPLTLEELDDLAAALRLDRSAVHLWPHARVTGVLELQVDLDAPTPVDDPRKAKEQTSCP